MADYLLVTTVTVDRETAAMLARSAVEARLAACAQVHGPVSSFFWHLGELGEGQEWQVTFKTTGARYAELEQHLISAHSWDNPEVTAIALEAGSESYLRWLDSSTDRPDN
jgi:periplasmic divalent cation tolerance protein